MEESETLELKKSTSELKEAIISIAAILNKHKKGEVYFGVNPNGEVVGQCVSDSTLREISRVISDNIEPKIFPKIEQVNFGGKCCIKVEFEGKEIPYFAYGRVYVRTGTENKQISAKELENMILHKNKEKLRWDNQLCEKATLEDIDEKTVRDFVRLAKDSKRVQIKNESIELILKKLGLLNEGKVTNAGILLFGKSPKKFFVNALVKCGRFKDEASKEFIDIRDFDGNLFNSLESSINFLKEHIRVSARIEGLLRKEKWEIPIDALREAIINSLIHRDYLISGFIYIKIYDNKIIISNPGKLPEQISLEDLYNKHESIPKNPLLADAFYYAGYIDAWGRGSLNILRALKENGLDKALFEQSAGYFRIIFNRPKEVGGVTGGVTGGVNLLEHIEKNPGKRTSQMMKDTNMAKRTIERQLKKLREEGKIEFRGSAKTGGYFIKNG